jgi:hypothetical protein
MSVCCRNLACWTTEGSAVSDLSRGHLRIGMVGAKPARSGDSRVLERGRGTACRLESAGGLWVSLKKGAMADVDINGTGAGSGR